jgi:hypothetical protein
MREHTSCAVYGQRECQEWQCVPVRVNACAGLGGRAGLCFGEVRSDVPASLTQSSSSASVVLMERHFMTAPNDCEQSEWGY